MSTQEIKRRDFIKSMLATLSIRVLDPNGSGLYWE